MAVASMSNKWRRFFATKKLDFFFCYFKFFLINFLQFVLSLLLVLSSHAAVATSLQRTLNSTKEGRLNVRKTHRLVRHGTIKTHF